MLDLLLQQAGQSEPGFASETIKWAIHCTGEGGFTGVTALGEEDKGQRFSQCPKTPNMNSGGKSHFLADSLAAVVLFFDDEIDGKINDKIKPGDRIKFSVRQQFFLELLRQAQSAMPALAAPVRLVENAEQVAQIHATLQQHKAKPTDLVTFMVEGEILLAQREWHDWWRSYLKPQADTSKQVGELMLDFATGELVKPASTHPKVKGLAGVGGLGTGDVLAGFDKEAFQSFGLKKSCNAAMSDVSATAYVERLNELIRQKQVRLGNTLCTYWFTESIPDEEDPLFWMKEPEETTRAAAEQKAKALLKAIREGKRADVNDCRYVALLLSGAAGRVMVRDVMQGSFERLVDYVARWFQDLAIVHRNGSTTAPEPKFLAVAGAMVRELKDLPPPLIQQLWRAALTGVMIPYVAMAQATLRIRIDIVADTPFNHARMSLIKAFHIRQGDQEMQPYLNPEHSSTAYQCGRLMAILASLQRAALGDVGAGVVQRYYTAASQTPGMVLGRLVANAKNHLNKLEGGLAWWYEERVAEVMSRMGDGFPTTHTLQEQSLFALGYYQQLASLRAGKQTDTATASLAE